MLAGDAAQFLATLNRQLRALAPGYAVSMGEWLKDLTSLLNEIHQFVLEEQTRSLAKRILRPDARISHINRFRQRLETISYASQISALIVLLNQRVREDQDRAVLDQEISSVNARLRVLEQNQTESRRTPDAVHANLKSAAEMVSQDAIDASGGSLASPASDVAISFEDQGSVIGSKVLSLSPDITHKLRLVPSGAPSFMQPAVCVLEEGLCSPLWIGCPRDESYPRVAYGERIEYCHAELYAIPGPRFFVRDPTGRGVRLNGRSLSVADLHQVKDGDIIHLNIRYSDRLGITHPATGLKIELVSAPHSKSVQCLDALRRCDSSLNTANRSTLVQFDVFDPPSFPAVLCQLVDDARPVSLRRSHVENTSSAIIFDSMTVSRRHAAIWCEKGQVFIVDRHSTHGTFLNGHRLQQGSTLSSAEVLVDRDILRIGAIDERAAIRGVIVQLRVLRISE